MRVVPRCDSSDLPRCYGNTAQERNLRLTIKLRCRVQWGFESLPDNHCRVAQRQRHPEVNLKLPLQT